MYFEALLTLERWNIFYLYHDVLKFPWPSLASVMCNRRILIIASQSFFFFMMLDIMKVSWSSLTQMAVGLLTWHSRFQNLNDQLGSIQSKNLLNQYLEGFLIWEL